MDKKINLNNNRETKSPTETPVSRASNVTPPAGQHGCLLPPTHTDTSLNVSGKKTEVVWLTVSQCAQEKQELLRINIQVVQILVGLFLNRNPNLDTDPACFFAIKLTLHYDSITYLH